MHKLLFGALGALSLTLFGLSPAKADWSLNTDLMSQSLFPNAGASATTGPAMFVIPKWTDTGSGVYVEPFVILPLQHRNGAEVDMRLGMEKDVGMFHIDVSLANYTFGDERANVYDTLNGRAVVSTSFTVDGNFSITPYVGLDYQRSVDALRRGDSLGVVAGINLNVKRLPIPGNPSLTVDASTWNYAFNQLAPGKGPIEVLKTWMLFPVGINGVMFETGPIGMVSHGAIARPFDRTEYALGWRFFKKF